MSSSMNRTDLGVKPGSAQTNQTCLGSFVRADGTTAVMADVSGRVATQQRGTHRPTPSGWNLASDAFHRSFTDVIASTTQTAALPDMQGAGMVRMKVDVMAANDAAFRSNKSKRWA